jgi:ubiquinone/menaquinone biosynthesis C-methylase UbiE
MRERKEKIKKAYVDSKNIYDGLLTGKSFIGKVYTRFFWAVDDLAVARLVLGNIPRGFLGKLLDVPVGTGVFTAETYKALPEASITALDYSADMLEQAEARFEEHGISNVSFEQGDVGSMPYDDAAFDIVLSMNGFHVFPDKSRAFSETARVLRPGGIFCGCTYISGQRWRTDFLARCVLAPKGWFTPPFWEKDELAAMLKQHYSVAEVNNLNSMAIFRCVK